MKRLLSLLLVSALCLSIAPRSRAADPVWMDSGDHSLPKPSKEEITELIFSSSRIGFDPDTLFTDAPSLEDYAPGSLSEDTLDGMLQRVNALRLLAGLNPVSLAPSFNDMSQAAALLSARNNSLSSAPAQPEGMPDGLYETAYEAFADSITTAQSVTVLEGYSPAAFANSFLRENQQQRQEMGHRRSLLNPALQSTGFGLFPSEDGTAYYTIQYIGETAEHDTDYDFIAWPASGDFPAPKWNFNRPQAQTAFDGQVAWSVSLNPRRYEAPSIEEVRITLTREADGKTWSFPDTDHPENYWNIAAKDYGEGPCIIFQPGDDLQYQGLYSVEITGLKDSVGQPAVLRYQVDFFDPANYAVERAKAECAAETEPVFTDVPVDHWAYPAIQLAYEAGIVTGISRDTAVFGMVPEVNGRISAGELMSALVNMYYPEELETPEEGAAWYTPAMQVASDHGLLNHLVLSVQDGAKKLSRSDIAMVIYNLLEEHGLFLPVEETKIAIFDQFPDITYDVTEWKCHGIGTVVAYGIMNGTGIGFSPDSSFTRAELATVCCSLMFCCPPVSASSETNSPAAAASAPARP